VALFNGVYYVTGKWGVAAARDSSAGNPERHAERRIPTAWFCCPLSRAARSGGHVQESAGRLMIGESSGPARGAQAGP
jgi:hypothetical protein